MFRVLPAETRQTDADVVFTTDHRLLPRLIRWSSASVFLLIVSELIASRTHLMFTNVLGRPPEMSRTAPRTTPHDASSEGAANPEITLADGKATSPEATPADEVQQDSDLLSSKHVPPRGSPRLQCLA